MTHNQQNRPHLAGPAARRTPILLAAFALATVFLLASVVTGAGATGEETRLYMDVHRLGAGNVTLEAVAEAHAKDLAIQDEHGVDYQRYWVDEAEGTVYCLVDAPSAEAAAEVHRQAHGLVADEVVEVRPGILPAEPAGERKLFMDTHLVGAVRGEDVAAAHLRDLEVQEEFGVSFLEYWYDEASGKIHCLAEAPDADAVRAAHGKAHGLVPDEVREVQPGH